MSARSLLCAALMVPTLASGPRARDIEITRSCFTGFCVESVEAFTTLARDAAAGKYRLLLSRTQSILYIEAGSKPVFPHCGLCSLEEKAGERVSRQNRTGRIMGRLIGPFEGCKGTAPFYVHVYVYLPDANPGAVSVERNCEVRSPR
jgi:hypothetical protein